IQAKEAPDGSYTLDDGRIDALAGTYVRRLKAARLNRDPGEFFALPTEGEECSPRFKKQLDDPVWAAHWWLTLEINRHMAGSATDGLRAAVSAALLPTRLTAPLAFDIRIRPQTLLGAIYVAFAVEVSGAEAHSRRRCPACGETFTPRRRDQAYCRPSCRTLAKYHRDHPAGERSAGIHTQEE
ncbi:MAG: hypothetical protein ACYDAG_06770, partial [Chloroflexota bacterium]